MDKDGKKVSGKIHSVETLGAADGPGLRFVLFLQGCGLRCKYCHNPDTWAACNAERTATAEDIANEIIRYKNYFGKKGGVTVSGGEPLLQLDFLTELFKILKQNGIHTAIDTSGAPYNEYDPRYKELLALTDLVILDIKHINDLKCRELTGTGNIATKKFAKTLSDNGVAMWIRQVLVPGLTDDENDLKRTREWINTLKTVERVEVLPYHTLGKPKYEQLGLSYPLGDTPIPTREQIDKAKAILIG